jgi:carbonic anhydrase
MRPLFSSIIIALLFFSCNNTAPKYESSADSSTAQVTNHPVLVEKVLTKEERDALTPDHVLQSLKDGNNRFMNDSLTDRLHSHKCALLPLVNIRKQ